MSNLEVTFEGAIAHAFSGGKARALVINGVTGLPTGVKPHYSRLIIPTAAITGSIPAGVNYTTQGNIYTIELEDFEVSVTTMNGPRPGSLDGNIVPQLTLVDPRFKKLFPSWDSKRPDPNCVRAYMDLEGTMSVTPYPQRGHFQPDFEGKPNREFAQSVKMTATIGAGAQLVLRKFDDSFTATIPLAAGDIAFAITNNDIGAGSLKDFNLQYKLADPPMQEGPIPEVTTTSSSLPRSGTPGCTNSQFP
jgi:hypothetical protein